MPTWVIVTLLAALIPGPDSTHDRPRKKMRCGRLLGVRPAYRVAALVMLLVAVCASPQQALSVDKFFGSTWQDSQDPLFGTLFNQITPENYGKWHLVEPSDNNYQWSSLDNMYSFAAAKGLVIKEHTFVWGWAEPSWVNSANAAAAVDDWISDYMTRYTGQVDLIDVVNEPIHELPSYSDGLGGSGATGWDWLIWCYQKARQYAPDSTLILNEYFALTSDDMANQVKTLSILLKDRGLLDAIGEQGHFMEGTSAADIRRRLDLLSEVGLPIYISEYDVDVSDDQQQLSIYQNQFPVMWEHPNVRGITLWGHREGRIWRTNAYLVRSDGSERPALTWLRGYLASAPGMATDPFPENGAADVPNNAFLSWGHGYAATSGEVYFGTNASPGAAEYKGRQFPLSFDPGPLEDGKTYYWRINEANANGISTGAVWSFTVGDGGGTVTNYTLGGTNWTAHIFRMVGTTSRAIAATGKVEVLVVGGGGGGAGGGLYYGGGGGGAGGIIVSSYNSTTSRTYSITVGNGGRSGTATGDSAGDGGDGGYSAFDTFKAGGGGGGGRYSQNGRSGTSPSGATVGGCGGGAGRDGSLTRSSAGSPDGNGVTTYNSAGGATVRGVEGSYLSAAGGGGAGGPGFDGYDDHQSLTGAYAQGGAGLLLDFMGSTNWYAGGGGGAWQTGTTVPLGGSGVGGNGNHNSAGQVGGNGAVNTGSGGGGGYLGGAGGSGIVIVRYMTARVLSPYELWQQTYFTAEQLTNSAIMGDAADPDGDGMNNLNEFYAGTIPTNQLSVLCLTDTTFHAPSSEFVIRWQSVSDRWYTVQAATNLLNGFNLILGTNIFANPPENVHTDSVSGVGCRFYRVEVEPVE